MATAHSMLTGEMLVSRGVISRDQLAFCIQAQSVLGQSGPRPKIGEMIFNYGFATRQQIEEAIAVTGKVAEDLGVIAFPAPLLKRLKAYPLSLRDGVLSVAASGTLDKVDVDDFLAFAIESGLKAERVEVVPMDRMEVLKAINSLSSPDQALVMSELNALPEKLDDSVFINQMLKHLYIDALQERASDIHFLVSSRREYSWIAHRIDGALKFTYMVRPEAMSVIATRIKSDAGMDFSDTMRPHDGRTEISYNGKRVDIRVSTLPVDFGEKIVLRLLDSTNTPALDKLFSAHKPVLERVQQITATDQKTGGVVLITGATGSGKSTTLNAILTAMDRSRRSIGTVEDPVELRVPLVGHTQVNEAAGLSYSMVLRALMRQDPDVIMVGELRDSDTVETALRAAETGHMVLTTLHTDNVAESVTRLLGMMEPGFRNIGKFILASSLKGVVNQKLARKLCAKCTVEEEVSENEFNMLGKVIGFASMKKFFNKSVGCPRCNNTGYYGRLIVPEAMFINPDHEARTKFENILIADQPFREVFDLPGVLWYPRRTAVASVLADGIMDVTTALSLLDVHHKVRVGDPSMNGNLAMELRRP